VRDHRGEPRPGPSTTQSAASTAVDRLRARRRVGGLEGDRVDHAVGRRHLDLAADRRERVGVAGSTPAHLGGDVHRGQRHRQHPPGRAEQPADPVEGATGSPSCSQSPTISRLPITWPRISPCRRTGAGAPAPRCRPTRGRRTARPAPSAGRRGQHAELARSRPDEPPLSATVTTAVRSSTTRSCDERQMSNFLKRGGGGG
jgi:hypothetical protein